MLIYQNIINIYNYKLSNDIKNVLIMVFNKYYNINIYFII